jgi:hypothetical protein
LQGRYEADDIPGDDLNIDLQAKAEQVSEIRIDFKFRAGPSTIYMYVL